MNCVCAGFKCGRREICKNAECIPYQSLVYDYSISDKCSEENGFSEFVLGETTSEDLRRLIKAHLDQIAKLEREISILSTMKKGT